METCFKGDVNEIRFPGVFQCAVFGAHGLEHVGVRYWGTEGEYVQAMRDGEIYPCYDWGTPQVYYSLAYFIQFFGDIFTPEELSIIKANNKKENENGSSI